MDPLLIIQKIKTYFVGLVLSYPSLYYGLDMCAMKFIVLDVNHSARGSTFNRLR